MLPYYEDIKQYAELAKTSRYNYQDQVILNIEYDGFIYSQLHPRFNIDHINMPQISEDYLKTIYSEKK